MTFVDRSKADSATIAAAIFDVWRDEIVSDGNNQPRRRHKPKPRAIPSPESITPTTPLRLDIAAQLAFPDGSMGVSGLRTEINNGNLAAEKIAGRLYVTLAAIEDMRKLCALTTKGPESNSADQEDPATRGAGSSVTATPTDAGSSARQAHLRQTAKRLRDSARKRKKR
jgi:hypothetical protein